MILQFDRTCNCCGHFKPQLGGGIRIILNFRQWVCKKCKELIDKRKETPL